MLEFHWVPTFVNAWVNVPHSCPIDAVLRDLEVKVSNVRRNVIESVDEESRFLDLVGVSFSWLFEFEIAHVAIFSIVNSPDAVIEFVEIGLSAGTSPCSMEPVRLYKFVGIGRVPSD